MSSSEADAVTLSDFSSLSVSDSVTFELVTAKHWREEWTARDTASVRLQLLGRVLCCRNKPRIRRVRSKGAILVLLWNSLVLNHYGNLGFILAGVLELNSVHAAGVVYLLLTLIQSLSQMLLYPLTGWIADVYFGRYRVIKASLWLMWAGTVILSTGICISMLLPPSQGWMQTVFKILLPVALLAMETGIAGFNANAIPFGVDQLATGSGDQLSGFVMWFVFASSIKYAVLPFPFACPLVGSQSGHVLLQTFSQAILLTAALVLDSFFRDWFIMEPHTSNPFKLVATVLRYAWKHKQPQFRSAFTYHEDTKPSRIEFAKESYGGPFTAEQVEDVKTFLRIVLALLPIGGALVLNIFMSQTTTLFSKHINSDSIPCYGYQAMSVYLSYFIIVCAVPFHEFLIHPIMRNYIPTILTRYGIGIFLNILSCIALFTIDFVGHEEGTGGANYTCMYNEATQVNSLSINHYWILLPRSLIGLGLFFNLTAIYDFVFSQSPYNMKGLLMGAIYAVNGFFLFLSLTLQVPFYLGYVDNLTNIPSCGSVYLLLLLALGIFWFIVYVLVARGYRKRERGETKRQQDYPEEYYSKYIQSTRR